MLNFVTYEITFATIVATKTHVNLLMGNITSLIEKIASKPVHIQIVRVLMEATYLFRRECSKIE